MMSSCRLLIWQLINDMLNAGPCCLLTDPEEFRSQHGNKFKKRLGSMKWDFMSFLWIFSIKGRESQIEFVCNGDDPAVKPPVRLTGISWNLTAALLATTDLNKRCFSSPLDSATKAAWCQLRPLAREASTAILHKSAIIRSICISWTMDYARHCILPSLSSMTIRTNNQWLTHLFPAQLTTLNL